MITQLNEKINIKLYLNLLFSIAFLVSCGGGGGGGGGSSNSSGLGTGFTISTIDNIGDVGWNTDIATGPNGSIHISYYDNTNGHLKYAYYNGSSWNTETIDSSSSDVGDFSTSIAVESDGTVHISYYDFNSGNLKYATGTFGSWNKEIVDSAGDVGKYSSIAVDSNGTVHISYYNSSSEDLKYATNAGVTTACYTGSHFKCETVDSTGIVGDDTSIAVKSDGTVVHISYHDFTNGNLKYATNASVTTACSAGSTFKCETVDNSSDDVGEASSIAVESNGTVHISYYNHTIGDLKYATGTFGSWHKETVNSTGDVGDYSSIAVDSNHTVHISYYDLDNENLKYASGTSGAFNYATIDSTGRVGEFSSIAVASDGKVHISYYDFTNGNLKYAVK